MVSRLPCRNYLILGAFFLACAGCGEKFHPVSGTVTLDGKPFDHGSITIIPANGGAPAFGGTDDQGSFTLNNNNNTGVRAGTYKVTLQKFPPEKPNSKDNEDAARKGNFETKPFNPVPKDFAKPETSTISISVPSADGKYIIDVKSK